MRFKNHDSFEEINVIIKGINEVLARIIRTGELTTKGSSEFVAVTAEGASAVSGLLALAKLIDQHRHDNERADRDLEDERVDPEQVPAIP